MNFSHELSKDEHELFLKLLKELFNSINAKVELSDKPSIYYESKTGNILDEANKNFKYTIKISNGLGDFEYSNGFNNEIEIKNQIKHLVFNIGVMYWIKKDGKKDSVLDKKLREINKINI